MTARSKKEIRKSKLRAANESLRASVIDRVRRSSAELLELAVSDTFDSDTATALALGISETLHELELLLSGYRVRKVVVEPSFVLKEAASRGCGRLAAVRPAGSDKTHVGVYLGLIPFSAEVRITRDTVTAGLGRGNPAFFVPSLKAVVFGYESWWHFIEKREDMRDITDPDIENIWYVRELNKLMEDRNGGDNKRGPGAGEQGRGETDKVSSCPGERPVPDCQGGGQ